ncbi:MAG: hypothetical protein RSD78_09180, partial [Oscillospiraceae bacterium]
CACYRTCTIKTVLRNSFNKTSLRTCLLKNLSYVRAIAHAQLKLFCETVLIKQVCGLVCLKIYSNVRAIAHAGLKLLCKTISTNSLLITNNTNGYINVGVKHYVQGLLQNLSGGF